MQLYVLNMFIFALTVLPLGILASEYFRARHDKRQLVLSLAYIVFAINECLFLVFTRPFYFYHVFLDGFIISIAVVLFVTQRKESLTYPTQYFFHQAFLYLALFAIIALAIITPEKSYTLAMAVVILIGVFSLLVVVQSRYRSNPILYILLCLWVGAHLGMYQYDMLYNRLITVSLFALIAARIGLATTLTNRKMYSDNILLFKSRDMVLSMLNDIAASPEHLSSVDRTLGRVLETVRESLSVEAAAFYRLEKGPEGTFLKHALSCGTFYPLSPEDEFVLSKPQLIADHLEKSQFALNEGVVGSVAATLQPLILDRRTTYSRMMALGLNTRLIRCLLAIPFKNKEELLGVFIIQNTKNGEPFELDDQHLLEALADQAAISVNNTKMYAELAQTVRLRQETNIAMRIQKQLLPTSTPTSEHLRIAAFIEPAKEVGGDYYDFIHHDDKSLGIAIGDVSGKGVPAGMIMAIAKVIVQIVARGRQDVKEIVTLFSKEIYPYMQQGQFMTLNYLRWVGSSRTLYFAGAGHEHILWFHAQTGQTEKIKAGGLAAGLLQDSSALIKQNAINTEKGDIIVLYTDGVTEARNATKEMFTLRRLQAALESYGYMGEPERIRNEIVRDVTEFMGGTEQFDDITLLVLSVG